MWRTVEGEEGMTAARLAGEIAAAHKAALQTFRTGLENIVINCHGFRGGLHFGGLSSPDIRHGNTQLRGDLAVLGILKPLNIGTIWIVSCDVAGGELGQRFCQTLASTAGTQVIASDTGQIVTNSQGLALAAMWFHDYIDDFEGTVYSFTPVGVMRKGIDPEKDVSTVGSNYPRPVTRMARYR